MVSPIIDAVFRASLQQTSTMMGIPHMVIHLKPGSKTHAMKAAMPYSSLLMSVLCGVICESRLAGLTLNVGGANVDVATRGINVVDCDVAAAVWAQVDSVGVVDWSCRVIAPLETGVVDWSSRVIPAGIVDWSCRVDPHLEAGVVDWSSTITAHLEVGVVDWSSRVIAHPEGVEGYHFLSYCCQLTSSERWEEGAYGYLTSRSFSMTPGSRSCEKSVKSQYFRERCCKPE